MKNSHPASLAAKRRLHSVVLCMPSWKLRRRRPGNDGLSWTPDLMSQTSDAGLQFHFKPTDHLFLSPPAVFLDMLSHTFSGCFCCQQIVCLLAADTGSTKLISSWRLHQGECAINAVWRPRRVGWTPSSFQRARPKSIFYPRTRGQISRCQKQNWKINQLPFLQSLSVIAFNWSRYISSIPSDWLKKEYKEVYFRYMHAHTHSVHHNGERRGQSGVKY